MLLEAIVLTSTKRGRNHWPTFEKLRRATAALRHGKRGGCVESYSQKQENHQRMPMTSVWNTRKREYMHTVLVGLAEFLVKLHTVCNQSVVDLLGRSLLSMQIRR